MSLKYEYWNDKMLTKHICYGIVLMLCFKPTMFNDPLNLVLSISHTMGTNMAWVKKSYIDQNCCSMMKSSVGHDNRCKKCSTTKNYGIQCYFLLGITLCNNFLLWISFFYQQTSNMLFGQFTMLISFSWWSFTSTIECYINV